MAGYQSCTIVGNVGRDVNFKFTQSGIPVADFSVAVTRRLGRAGDEGQQREVTTWFRVTCWRRLAEIARDYVRKGTPILVVGTVEVSSYMDKNNQPAATLELTADTFQMLGSKGDSAGQGEYSGSSDYGSAPSNADDIPF